MLNNNSIKNLMMPSKASYNFVPTCLITSIMMDTHVGMNMSFGASAQTGQHLCYLLFVNYHI